MTEVTQSPLAKYYRQPKLSIKLPTNGLWYDSNDVEVDANGSVSILPMSGLDEIKNQTPDMVADDKFRLHLIKSCVPAVKDPSKLTSVDTLSLMLGIFAASRGRGYKAGGFCPHCLEKYNKAPTEEDKQKLLDDSVVNIKEQEFEMTTDNIISQTVYCTDKNIFIEDNGLRIYLRPLSVSAIDTYNSAAFYQQMLQNRIAELQDSDTYDEETTKKIIDEIKEESKKYSDMIFSDILEMLTLSVDYIEILESGLKIDDREEIANFIKNASYSVVEKIRNKRDESIDILGLPTEVKVECNTCHKLFDVPVSVFNPTAFFEVAS